MMLAARGIFLAARRNRKPTAKSYVQDGLVAMWDGIENAGWGVHDPNATTWVDLSGNGYDASVPSALIRDNYMLDDYSVYSAKYSTVQEYRDKALILPFYGENDRCKTAEFVFDRLGLNRNWFSIVANWDDTFSLGWSDSNSLAWNYPVTRPTAIGMYHGGVSVVRNGSHAMMFCNGILVSQNSTSFKTWNNSPLVWEDVWGQDRGKKKLYAVRLYSRALSSAEIAANYAIDKARFNLPDAT